MTNFDESALDLLAAGDIDEQDARALQQMAALYDRLDPVPPALIDRIQFGITLDALHAEIAEVQRSGDLAGVRSGEATEAQTVTFTSANLTTMVTITPTGTDAVRVDGWIAPGAVVTVELRLVGSVMTTDSDDDGRFVFEDVPRGLAQFVIRASDPSVRPVVTPSIDL
jgi:hypothetical protein